VNSHPFDTLPLENGAGIIFTPCPGTKGVELKESLSQLQQGGAVAVLSMTPPAEMQTLQVTELPTQCAALGVQWFNLPVEDDAAPAAPFEAAWQAHQAEIMALLAAGKTLAIHCKGGSGRTGLMAAMLQIALGRSLQAATEAVQSLRPKALTIPAHVVYLKQFASHYE